MKLIAKTLAYTGIAATLGLSSIIHSLPAEAADGKNAVTFQINSTAYSDESGNHKLAAAPYLLNRTTMVPVRALAESMGATVAWDGTQGAVTVTGAAFGTLTLSVNSSTILSNKGYKQALPEKITNKGGTIFVPARGISTAMKASVAWHNPTQSLTITGDAQAEEGAAYHYDFEQDLQGWTGHFADLPVGYEESIYELEFARGIVPGDAGSAPNYALKLKGMNRSDDLFMFIQRKIEGLLPNTTYEAKLSFDMFTEESGQMIGIGGSPGESVVIKAGVVGKEPIVEQVKEGEDSYYRLNLDKGNQLTEGKDAKIVGNIVKPDSDKEGFQRVPLTYSVKATTNANGELFVLIGSDSGYEGLTTLYFDHISLQLSH